MNFSTKICKQIVNIILPKIHTLFTLYSLTFGLACAIIDTESEGNTMLKCLNCGSTAQVKKIGDVCNDNTVIEIYQCGCGAKIERVLNVSSVAYWSPTGTRLKVEKK